MKRDNYLSELNRLDLFHQIWSEPFADITYWGGIKNDDLADLCVYNHIPLPNPSLTLENIDFSSTLKPKFLKIRNIELNKIDGITDEYVSLKFIDINSLNEIKLKSGKGLDYLDYKSQLNLKEWCFSLSVVEHIKYYHTSITEHKIEYEYRIHRDAEHPFYETEKYLNPFSNPLTNSKIEYRKNKCVLPISVSDENRKYAYSIMETLLRIITTLNGKIEISASEDQDNCQIEIFDNLFNIYLDEIYIKRRYIVNNVDSKNKMLRPSYEKIPSGKFKLTIEESTMGNIGEKSKTSNKIVLENVEAENKKWLSDFVLFIMDSSIQEKIRLYIKYSKYALEEQIKKQEELNTERMKQEKEYLETLQKNKQLVINNIDQRMHDFDRVKKIRFFIEDLNKYITSYEDKDNSALIVKYIKFLEEQIKSYDPISHILDDSKLI